MIPTDLIKGSVKTIVLKLLKENGRMYGYDIKCIHLALLQMKIMTLQLING